MKYTALLIFLLLVAISGCSVLQNSETYYLEHPRGAPFIGVSTKIEICYETNRTDHDSLT